jgi:tetratricopeptide (TPR) repeat protein
MYTAETMTTRESAPSTLREASLRWASLAAEKQFANRKGHGGNPMLAERHLSRQELQVLFAAAFEAGAALAPRSETVASAVAEAMEAARCSEVSCSVLACIRRVGLGGKSCAVCKPLATGAPQTETAEAIALRAWQDAFGTTQLSHAVARLEAAEKQAPHTETAPARDEELDDALTAAIRYEAALRQVQQAATRDDAIAIAWAALTEEPTPQAGNRAAATSSTKLLTGDLEQAIRNVRAACFTSPILLASIDVIEEALGLAPGASDVQEAPAPPAAR